MDRHDSWINVLISQRESKEHFAPNVSRFCLLKDEMSGGKVKVFKVKNGLSCLANKTIFGHFSYFGGVMADMYLRN